MLYLADVKADKFLLPHHSCSQHQEYREFLSKTRELCANQSVWQLKTIKLLYFFFWFISFMPNFFTTLLLFSSFQHQNLLLSFQFELIMLETLFHSKKSTGRQLSPFPWLQWTKANCHWKSTVAVTGDSTEVPLKNKIKKKNQNRKDTSVSVVLYAAQHLHPPKRRGYMNCIWSHPNPMSLMHRWYLAYAYIPESSRGFSTFIQCWSSHACCHFCSFTHRVFHPTRERNCNSVPCSPTDEGEMTWSERISTYPTCTWGIT